MTPWKVRIPRVEIVGWDEVGPFEFWGQAESERIKQGNNPSFKAEVVKS